MNALEITDSKAGMLDELEMASLKVLLGVLKDGKVMSDEGKVAMQALNVVGKNRQTLTAREGIRFSMAKTLARDPEQLKKYVAASQPEIRKLLTGKAS